MVHCTALGGQRGEGGKGERERGEGERERERERVDSYDSYK
jgi:hypothetical protein